MDLWWFSFLPEDVEMSPERDDTFVVIEDVFVVIDCSTAAELTGIIGFDKLPIVAADGEFIVYTVGTSGKRADILD